MDKVKKSFTNLSKRYGPGFVAYSKKSGRVLAHGRDIQRMYEDAEKKNLDLTKIVISHVPRYGVFSAYRDTGSDLTTLPFFMALKLKIDLVLQGKVITVRASITNDNSTPFLLGRVDVLDVLYSWNFDALRKEIVFEPL